MLVKVTRTNLRQLLWKFVIYLIQGTSNDIKLQLFHNRSFTKILKFSCYQAHNCLSTQYSIKITQFCQPQPKRDPNSYRNMKKTSYSSNKEKGELIVHPITAEEIKQIELTHFSKYRNCP